MDQSILVENLEQQLSEMEMLQSMFSNDGEFDVFNKNLFEQIDKYVKDSDGAEVPKDVDFTLNLSIEDYRFEFNVHFPNEYPKLIKPEIYVRLQKISRKLEAELNRDLCLYMESLDRGEQLVLTLVLWLQENGTTYVARQRDEEKVVRPEEPAVEHSFARLWIYSHHIYSKVKRKNILGLADEFGLTGFSMPGKPGIICVEGLARNTNEWWACVKSWNWKKINVKITEEESLLDGDQMEGPRRFSDFKEIGFVKNSESRDYHMDMSEFHSFLKLHNSEYMFKELFGIDKT